MRLTRRIALFVADLLLVVLMPDKLFKLACERRGGHTFSVSVLHTEDESSFVIDPTVRCDRCRTVMPESVYGALTDAYAAGLADEEAW